MLFHVNDQETEIDFNFEDKLYEFIDIETSEKVQLNSSFVRSSYKKNISEYLEAIKLKCFSYKIDFVDTNIQAGFRSVLESYLIKKRKMS